MKASPANVVKAHLATYVDRNTGERSWQDYAVFYAVPIGAGILCAYFGVRLKSDAAVGLLTVAGLLSAFFFGAMLQMSERAMTWADKPPGPGRQTTRQARFLKEVAANAGYAALVCIATAAVFVVVSASDDPTPVLISSAVGVMFAVHLVLVLFMVMRRTFALTVSRLEDAETAVPADVTPRPTKLKP